ncbi:GNAT family N-acetyltransferase [Thalassobaculum sp.]|uniref:GNAT family N-acetyltransferase n=1 Tax=Thalassobaculum sp. TaxID=2022740 RepID=UPI0032EC9892
MIDRKTPAPDIVCVRPAVPDDMVGITELQAASFADRWSLESVQQLAGLSGAIVLVAERPASPAMLGYLIGQVVTDEAEVHSIAVAEAFRRRGIGRRLLLAFEGLATGLGAVSAVLEVAADDAPAKQLYESIGYQVVARRPDYYRIGRAEPVDAEVRRRRIG